MSVRDGDQARSWRVCREDMRLFSDTLIADPALGGG
jgi:hypothetical protein